jgi:transcriptional regulator with XRE-family HTH domain
MALLVLIRYAMSQVRPKTAPQIVGNNISTRRKSLGITQEVLALAIGYSRRQVGRIERGEVSLPTELLPAIGQVLKLNNPLVLTREDVFEQWL